MCIGRSREAEAFKRAMGRLAVSLKENDVDGLIMCLYSDNIISESSRDKFLSPTAHHSELVRKNSLLCYLETKIRENPPLYEELIRIFTNRLHRHSLGDILRKTVAY